MEYVARTPAAPLDSFIERLWYCSDAPSHARERVLPGGGVDLIINLAGEQVCVFEPEPPHDMRAYAGAVIRGPWTRCFLVDPRQRASVVGVHFRPGGAFPFLGISPSEIVDAFVPLGDVWGRAGALLREQLLEARSPHERLRLVEAALWRKLQHARRGHPAARAAIAAFGGSEVRVAEVASLVGLSHRGFVQVFQREVGLTPKLYARLQRFHRAKQRIASHGAPRSWATFAIDCGYFDQSHMIRDFVGFSGISPTGYLQRRSGETMFDNLIHGDRLPGVERPTSRSA